MVFSRGHQYFHWERYPVSVAEGLLLLVLLLLMYSENWGKILDLVRLSAAGC